MMGQYWQDRTYVASLGVLLAVIVVAGAFVLAGGSSGEAESPLQAGAIATPISSAMPTATVDAATLDFARALDLLAIRDALSAYHEEYGDVPDTGGEVVTLCEEPDDAACALSDFNDELAFDDGVSPYWYASDGATYTLIARAAEEQPSGQSCPSRLPAALSDGPVMCMTGEGE
jgi:hypothetical protein